MEIFQIQNQVEMDIQAMEQVLIEKKYKLAQKELFLKWLNMYPSLEDVDKLRADNKKIFNEDFTEELEHYISIVAENERENSLDSNED